MPIYAEKICDIRTLLRLIMSGNEAWDRNVFKRGLKVDRDGVDITLSGRLFQVVGPATGKARPPTVDSFTKNAAISETCGHRRTCA